MDDDSGTLGIGIGAKPGRWMNAPPSGPRLVYIFIFYMFTSCLLATPPSASPNSPLPALLYTGWSTINYLNRRIKFIYFVPIVPFVRDGRFLVILQ